MGSIRPLFTITVLVVVGAYLYVKINEGPVRQRGELHAGHDQAADGVPPLVSTSGGATLAQDTTAPAWPASEANSTSTTPPLSAAPAIPAPAGAPPLAATTSDSAAGSGEEKNSMPEVPPIPELPELPKITDASPGAAAPAGGTAAAPALEMPKNVPAAQYGDAGPQLGAGATGTEAAAAPGALPALPSLPTETPNAATPNSASPDNMTAMPGAQAGNVGAVPNSFGATPNMSNTMPAAGDRYGGSGLIPTAPAPTTPAMPSEEPAAPGAPMIPAIPAGVQIPDRYGVGASATPEPPAVTPIAGVPGAAATESFAASWPAIQAALDKRDLKQAHQLLSKWHANDSLSPADAQKVETLLGQLAGTVIYSTEHQLEPARIVKPGESLETIAKEYNVPWQLLAKINSITAPNQVRPGQELKVVRGPFSAVVDLRRSEMSLEVDGRYAGTFPVTVPPDVAVIEGQWLVEQILGMGSTAPMTASAPPATPFRRIILRNASAGSATVAATLMIDGDAGSRPSQPGAIRVAMQDAEDLSDILSIGSRVTVRR